MNHEKSRVMIFGKCGFFSFTFVKRAVTLIVVVNRIVKNLIAGQNYTASPYQSDYIHAVFDAQFWFQWVVDDVEAVEADGHQREHTYVDIQRVREGAQFT